MSYTYADLKCVESKIQELNRLCEQCDSLNALLRAELSDADDALKGAYSQIRGRQVWTGDDADSCGDAIHRLRQDIARAQNQFYEDMNAAHSALMDEVHRQQTLHSRIYRELNALEVLAGRALD